MNEVFANLIKQLKDAGAGARWAVASFVGMLVAVGAMLTWRAQNPHFVVLAADLDSQQLSASVAALASTDIRYVASMGPAPYMIQVEEGRVYEARTAIHQGGTFLGGARGIASDAGGTSAVFLGQSERHQRTQKRMWEEAEMQLEQLNYVLKAKVNISGSESSPLARLRPDQRRVSVVLTLGSLARPNATETRALVGIVRGATGVSDERITIVDQHSNVIYDDSGNGSTDTLLAIEERFARDRTEAMQSYLDKTFGAGLTVVGVSGEWRQVHEETITESLDPAKKPTNERILNTETPHFRRNIGGPAGVAANTQEGEDFDASLLSQPATATRSEEEKQYSMGSTTTHRIAQPHQLQRLSISLVVDESIADRVDDVVGLTKSFLSFDEERQDTIAFSTTSLPGLERDSEGTPVPAEPIEAPAPTNPALTMALEYGLEFVAGLAFLIVLLRSLKGAQAGAGSSVAADDGVAGPDGTPARRGRSRTGADDDDDVDMDALARAHIEELLQSEPEKVSALLSRWALSEEVYADARAN